MNRLHLAILLALLIALGVAAHLGTRLVTGPERSLLLSEGGAEWIRWQTRPTPHLRRIGKRRAVFRRRFFLTETPEEARLTVRGFRSSTVLANGQRVTGDSDEIDLAPFLHPGRNQLTVTVENDTGPPALLVRSRDLDLSTPESWWVSSSDSTWTRARLAAQRSPLAISREFPSAPESLARRLPELATFFLLGVAGSLLLARRARAHRIRWLLLGGWIALCVNNLLKLPRHLGFDVRSHYEYIDFIVENAKLPIATDGWEMYQSPLFYLLGALAVALAPEQLGSERVALLLRILPMLCGLAQIEIAFRSSRIVFPERNDLQIVGTLVGGFLPVNIYMSQAVGNEPLCGCLVAFLVLRAFKLLAQPSELPLWRSCSTLGLVFGLALLAKVSAIVLLPVILLLIVHLSRLRSSKPIEIVWSSLAFLISSTLVAGWYFIRNQVLFGKPFVGNWDPITEIRTWQDPGYRVAEDLLCFGEALSHPIYSSVMGFWDGLYSTLWLDGFLSGAAERSFSPPWNHEFMIAMALLSIPLAIAGLLGVALALRKPFTGPKQACLFSVASLGAYLAGILYMFLRIPAYTTFKSSFALGAVPCFAVLITLGVSAVPQNAISRAIIAGYLCSWLAFGYIAYFVW